MATGQALLDAEAQWQGQTYCQVNPDRYTPSSSCKDCSGAVVAAEIATGAPVVGFVSSTIGQAAQDAGRLTDYETAARTRGAFFEIVGNGNNGHIVIAWGDGVHYIGTPNRSGLLGLGLLSEFAFQRCGYLVGVDYTADGGPGADGQQPPAEWDGVYAVGMPGGHEDGVEEWQRRVNAAGCGPVVVDGDYGGFTASGVACLQRLLDVADDGEAGPITDAAWHAKFDPAPPPAPVPPAPVPEPPVPPVPVPPAPPVPPEPTPEPPGPVPPPVPPVPVPTPPPVSKPGLLARLLAWLRKVLRPFLLQFGKANGRVSVLQEGLRLLGHYVGTIDGLFGSRTRNGVQNFQRASGLAGTGIVDKATKAALVKALRG